MLVGESIKDLVAMICAILLMELAKVVILVEIQLERIRRESLEGIAKNTCDLCKLVVMQTCYLYFRTK